VEVRALAWEGQTQLDNLVVALRLMRRCKGRANTHKDNIIQGGRSHGSSNKVVVGVVVKARVMGRLKRGD
jgi:hypothetical protein